MGKSPGKWLKTLLFGKKSTRSRSSEGLSRKDSTRENGKKSLKDQDVRSLEKESPQDHVPSAVAPFEPPYLSRQNEQNGPVREQSKQGGYAGTDKLAVSTSIDKAVAMPADELREKPSESCIQEKPSIGHHWQHQQCVVIDSNQVRTFLSEAILIQHLHSALSNKAIHSPQRQNFCINNDNNNNNAPPGTLLLMPAWSQSPQTPYIGVKIVTAFPQNTHLGLPSISASYMLSDSYTGRALAFIDGTEITHWRTSCISALAASYLARQDAHVLAMVGAGQLAPYLIRAHLYVRPTLKKVIIWNRTPSKAQALVKSLGGRLGPGVEIQCGVDLDEIVGHADVISCATSSELPLVHGGVLKPGAHLDLVGSFSPSMRECDDEALARAKIFVDCEIALKEAGELVGAFGRGVIRPQDVVGTLAELVSGAKAGRSGLEEITVFKSVGSAAVDLVTAQLIYEKHVQATA